MEGTGSQFSVFFFFGGGGTGERRREGGGGQGARGFPISSLKEGLEHPRQPIRERRGGYFEEVWGKKVWKSFYNYEGASGGRRQPRRRGRLEDREGGSHSRRYSSLQSTPSRPACDLGALAGSMGAASCEDEELEFKLVFGEEKEAPPLGAGGSGEG